jgi:MSHA pilin protein MshA
VVILISGNYMKMINMKKQQGFTLIELVVVIVILGILAVTAAPKFINLQSDAQTATLQAIKASMETASTLVHSKSLIAGNETTAAGGGAANPTVVVNSGGGIVNLDFGYPVSTAGTTPVTVPSTDWGLLLDVNAADFLITNAVSGYIIVYPTGNTAPTAITDDCIAYYQEAQSSGARPTMAVVNCL